MPTRLVEQNHRMSTRRNRLRDLGEVQAHGLCGAAGQNQAGALTVIRADRSEDVGRRRALVLRRSGTGAPPGPAAGDLVLLPDPCLVAEPDLYRLVNCPVRDCRQTGGEGFLKADTSASLLA
jgi:hypothetical protein